MRDLDFCIEFLCHGTAHVRAFGRYITLMFSPFYLQNLSYSYPNNYQSCRFCKLYKGYCSTTCSAMHFGQHMGPSPHMCHSFLWNKFFTKSIFQATQHFCLFMTRQIPLGKCVVEEFSCILVPSLIQGLPFSFFYFHFIQINILLNLQIYIYTHIYQISVFLSLFMDYILYTFSFLCRIKE